MTLLLANNPIRIALRGPSASMPSLKEELRLHIALDRCRQLTKLLVVAVVARLPRKGVLELATDSDDRSTVLIMDLVSTKIILHMHVFRDADDPDRRRQ